MLNLPLFSYHTYELISAHAYIHTRTDTMQTSQLSRFGRETHDFLTNLTIACQSHDLAEILLLLCA